MYAVSKSRITRYLTERYKDAFLFDSLSDRYWEKEPRLGFMKGVEIPFKPEDLSSFKSGGLSIARMGENMVFVMGMDPAFPHGDKYGDFLRICFDVRVREAFLHDAGDALDKGDFLRACVLFRGVYLLAKEDKRTMEEEREESETRPEEKTAGQAGAENGKASQSVSESLRTGGAYECDAMIGLAEACSEMSRKLEEPGITDETEEESRLREEKCGNFKAEAMDLYETLTFLYPDFAPGWYYLGYCYLNMGLYAKTDLCFKKYLSLADEKKQAEEIREIEERRDQLVDPIQIERGCNAIIAGRDEEGIAILSPYKESQFRNWWPMHFYLAQAYIDTGEAEEAEAEYREVLRYSPSNTEAMQGLIDLYEATGKPELAGKYRRKLEILS